VLRIRNLDVAYGPVAALRRVSLHVRQGEVVAIVGANGAGKTTLLRAVAGLTRARGGEVAFDGADARRLPTEALVGRGLTLVPEGRQVFAAMAVEENLRLGALVQERRGRHDEVAADLRHVYELFPILRARARQLAARSPAASSRCWPSRGRS